MLDFFFRFLYFLPFIMSGYEVTANIKHNYLGKKDAEMAFIPRLSWLTFLEINQKKESRCSLSVDKQTKEGVSIQMYPKTFSSL